MKWAELDEARLQRMKTEKIQFPSDTLGNRLSTTRTEIVCALEFYLVKRLDDKSRMKREFHVRFCESLRGKYFGLLDLQKTAKKLPLLIWPIDSTLIQT
jgi:hypothetical protein